MSQRVHQVAKDLGLTSKEVITKLEELGISVKGHMSTVEEADVKKLIKHVEKKSSKPEVKEPKKELKKEAKKELKKEPKPCLGPLKDLELEIPISLGDLAKELDVKPNAIIKLLMDNNVFASINENLDKKMTESILKEFGFKLIMKKKPAPKQSAESVSDLLFEEEDNEKDLVPRSPVVTMMGHVDHGKTSLLDAIRKTNVTAKEYGGITQHIGAYEVFLKEGRVVFLDTPGHEAFTAMRARGANATDIVVLVIAADDGVMPQTIEAINHAKAAGVPIVVAVNKIDKPEADADKVRKQLTEYELVSEDWGGKTIFVNVSAITKQGIDNLLEMLLLESEMLELKANPKKKARGVVIEGFLDKNRGPIAHILIQDGTLKTGDVIVSEGLCGKVKALVNDRGIHIKEAGPATPVEVLGLNGVPTAGDKFFVAKTEKCAKEYCSKLKHEKKALLIEAHPKTMTLEDLYSQVARGNLKELKIIVKADVTGSLEVLRDTILKQATDKVKVNIIHQAIGAITESDVVLASASNAIIIGFHVKPDNKAQAIADKERVEIRLYRIIYDIVKDIKDAMLGLLDTTTVEVELGKVEVRNIFKISKIGNIAGCSVLKGKITRNSKIRLFRDNVIVHEGRLASLKRGKDDAKEVLEGFECGILLEKFNDIKEGDIIEAYTTKEEKQEL